MDLSNIKNPNGERNIPAILSTRRFLLCHRSHGRVRERDPLELRLIQCTGSRFAVIRAKRVMPPRRRSIGPMNPCDGDEPEMSYSIVNQSRESFSRDETDYSPAFDLGTCEIGSIIGVTTSDTIFPPARIHSVYLIYARAAVGIP